MQSTEIENWKPVVGYEGLYEVSDLGRMWSLERVNTRGYHRSGQYLTPYLDEVGRPRVTLTSGTIRRTRHIHQLVLSAFVGPCPIGMEGCHNDGDAANNRLSNLRWDTRSENQRDRTRHGRNANANKTHCKYGHLLSGPNVRASAKSKGWRSCVACDRAYKTAARRHTAFSRDLADAQYARIMASQ